MLAPSTVVPGTCCLTGTHLGRRVELAFVRALAEGELTIVHFSADDLTRCAGLLKTYGDAAIGFVDSSAAAIAQRLKIGKNHSFEEFQEL